MHSQYLDHILTVQSTDVLHGYHFCDFLINNPSVHIDALGGVKISPLLTPPRRLPEAPTVGDIVLSAKMSSPRVDSGCGAHKVTLPTIKTPAERAPAAYREENALPAL